MRVLDVQLRTVRVRAQQRFFVFLSFGEIHRGCEFLISAFSNENSILLSLNLPPFLTDPFIVRGCQDMFAAIK
jgi:hypothetical protein